MAPEEPNELTQILDILSIGAHDPTLPRWTIDDVAFEMDNILVSDNEECDMTDSNNDSGLDTLRR